MTQVVSAPAPVTSLAVSMKLFAGVSVELVAEVNASAAAVSGSALRDFSFDGVPPGEYRAEVFVGGVSSVTYLVKIDSAAGAFRVTDLEFPAVVDAGDQIAAGFVDYFETQNRVKGGVSVLKAIELVAAGVLGLSSNPAVNEERFVHLDGVTDAFTVQFSGGGHRSAVEVHPG